MLRKDEEKVFSKRKLNFVNTSLLLTNVLYDLFHLEHLSICSRIFIIIGLLPTVSYILNRNIDIVYFFQVVSHFDSYFNSLDLGHWSW